MMFAALTAVAEERDRYLYALEQARWDIRLLYASVELNPETDLGLRYLYADLDAVLSQMPNVVLSQTPNAVLTETPNADAIPLPPVPAALPKEEVRRGSDYSTQERLVTWPRDPAAHPERDLGAGWSPGPVAP